MAAQFANPSLSELMAPGQQRIGEIQQDANNFSQGVAQVPGIFDRYEAAKSRAEESARNSRPVTPWEKAAARLLAGHDPKAVAADTKAALAGQAPMNLGQGGMNAQPNMTPPMAQMPQVTSSGGTRMTNQPGMGFDNIPPRTPMQMQPPQMAQGQRQPSIGSPAQGEDIFNGMDHRDWQDYIGAMEKGHAAQYNKAQRDYLEEQRLRNQGNLDVQNARNVGGVDKQETVNKGTEAVANVKASSAHERIQQKTQEMLIKHKDYQDYLQVLRDKNAAWERISGGKQSSDPILNALVKDAQAATGAFEKIGSANILSITPKGAAEREKLKEEAATKWAKVQAYTATHPNSLNSFQTSQSKGQSSGTPAKTYKVGDPTPDGKYIIDEISPDGKQATKYHAAPN
jgi:hypothetical protein